MTYKEGYIANDMMIMDGERMRLKENKRDV
jgi:hypothetical protein